VLRFHRRRPDRRHRGPRRAHRDPLGAPPLRRQAGQPGEQAQDEGHRRGHRPGRRLGRGDAGGAGLPGRELLLPGQPPARALHRRAGRDQRREELPQRRRQRAPALLRHRQGRRLPRPGVQRAPPRRDQRADHRPVRGPGRSVRPRVRRPARQPVVRRRAGLPHLLRQGPDRPAAAAGRLPGPGAPDRRRHRDDALPPRDARARRGRRPGARHHRPRPRQRRDHHAPRRRRRARERRLRQRVLPVDQRQGLQRHGELAGPPQGRAVRQPLLHPDPPHVHPGVGRPPEQAHADERVAAQRRPRLGAQGDGRHPRPRRHTRGRARLLPRAPVPGVRQPRPARHRQPRRQGRVRRQARRRPDRPGRLPRLRRLDPAAGPPGRGGEVREPVPDVPADHRRGPLRGPDADLPRGALHDGRAVGRLRPAVHRPGPVRDRRGQLLRPRRQPARRLGADAGPGRRVLRAAQHHRRLPRRVEAAADRLDGPRGRRGAAGGGRADRAAALDRRHPHRRLVPPRAGPHHVGLLRHGAHRGRAAQGPRPHRRAAPRVLAHRQGARLGRDAQPVAGEGRPRGRLPRAGRVDVPGRAAPQRVLRRALPRGEPDRRRRGGARRRRLLLRRGVGVHRRGRAPGPAQGGPGLRLRHPEPAELQV
ncbi:MAG: Succinate dehydrogenase flavoprotein subunit, partial [uncultured Pseudonocardia sp.]